MCNIKLLSTHYIKYFSILDSIFKSHWPQIPSEWYQPSLANDFQTLQELRAVVNKALDIARSKQYIRSSLEATAYIVTNTKELDELISSTFSSSTEIMTSYVPNYTLNDFLIVSNVVLGHCDQQLECLVTHDVNYRGQVVAVTIGVEKCLGSYKCPRCWKYTVLEEKIDQLCDRCQHVWNKNM